MSLLDLAAVLQTGPQEERLRQKLEEKVDESNLLDDDLVPDWLIQMLGQVRDCQPTTTWVPFKLRGQDDSDALDFVRELENLLPVGFKDNEESWLLTFPTIGLEAAISFEGPAYKVSHLGTTWD